MKVIISDMRNKIKIADWAEILPLYMQLNEIFDKNKTTVADPNGAPPPLYVKIAADLADVVGVAWKDTTKRAALSKIKSKALAALKQTIMRYNKNHVCYYYY